MLMNEYRQIKENDLVQLKYNGSKRVPLWLSLSWAKVIKRNNRGNLIVQCLKEQGGFTRTIQKDDIISHKSNSI